MEILSTVDLFERSSPRTSVFNGAVFDSSALDDEALIGDAAVTGAETLLEPPDVECWAIDHMLDAE